MLLILLIFGCNRTTCDSKTLTKLAEAQCEAWLACPEFAPPIASTYEDLESCTAARLAFEKELCVWATDARCHGTIVPSKVRGCAGLFRDAAKTCENEPACVYVDTGYHENGMYQDVSLDCYDVTE
jgi:hypothetical protein